MVKLDELKVGQVIRWYWTPRERGAYNIGRWLDTTVVKIHSKMVTIRLADGSIVRVTPKYLEGKTR